MSRGAIREFDRSERVGAELLRALTGSLRMVKDPRLLEITIQEVRVSRDLAHAKVFFTYFPTDELDPERAREQARLLNGPIAGFLRGQLARTVRLRAVPQLTFVHDDSIRDGERLTALIDRAVAEAPAVEGPQPGHEAGDEPAGDADAR
ncbi:MAG: 30S ribosome-binding factor RbfA [Thiohalocapsa sp.]